MTNQSRVFKHALVFGSSPNFHDFCGLRSDLFAWRVLQECESLFKLRLINIPIGADESENYSPNCFVIKHVTILPNRLINHVSI